MAAHTKVKRVAVLSRLLSEGFFEDRREAERWLLAGQVIVDGVRAPSAGTLVSQTAPIQVRGLRRAYVSKGGYKLAGALEAFHFSVQDRVCVDAGASTGGFTDCLIKSGARLVYAVDVGYGQLMGSLRQDTRVINLEKTNISDESLLSLDPVPDFGTVDLSYLPLEKGVPAFSGILHGKGELCALVKPLFEIDNADARRTGVIAPEYYEPLLLDLIKRLNTLEGVIVQNITHSPVTGNAGTREFFLHIALGTEQSPPVLNEPVRAAVERALSIPEYVKPD